MSDNLERSLDSIVRSNRKRIEEEIVRYISLIDSTGHRLNVIVIDMRIDCIGCNECPRSDCNCKSTNIRKI